MGLACGGFFPATAQVIEMLVDAYPDARNETNSHGKTPLLNYLEACIHFKADPYPVVVQLLVTNDVAHKADIKGHTPLWEIGQAARLVLPNAKERQLNNFRKSLDYILVNHQYEDSTSILRDLWHLPPKLRYFSFEKKGVKQILNDSMQQAPYTGKSSTVTRKSNLMSKSQILTVFTLFCSHLDVGSVCPDNYHWCLYCGNCESN